MKYILPLFSLLFFSNAYSSHPMRTRSQKDQDIKTGQAIINSYLSTLSEEERFAEVARIVAKSYYRSNIKEYNDIAREVAQNPSFLTED